MLEAMRVVMIGLVLAGIYAVGAGWVVMVERVQSGDHAATYGEFFDHAAGGGDRGGVVVGIRVGVSRASGLFLLD